MKTILVAGSWFFLAVLPCAAQRAGGFRGRAAGGVTFTSPSGFGNVLYPGTGGPAAANLRQGNQNRRPGSRIAPIYPAYVGGFYGGGFYGSGLYGSGYAPDFSGQTQLDSQSQQSPAPPVIINQYFSSAPANEPITGPTSSIYHAGPDRSFAQRDAAAEEPPAQTYYLLAFKDHAIYSALTYWIEDKTLHYVTPQNTHNQASLDLVDAEFTKKLNQNRDVSFTSPADLKAAQ